MFDLKGKRSRALGLRPMLAIGGAAVMAIGMTQAVGTLAAPGDTDVASATSSISTENFFPTPLAPSVSCGRTKLSKAVVTWGSAGPGMSYRVEVFKDNKGAALWGADKSDSDRSYTMPNTGVGTIGTSYRVRIYTRNVASSSTEALRVKSSGYISHTTYANSSTLSSCSGNGYLTDAENMGWENEADWSPADPVTTFSRGMFNTDLLDAIDSEPLESEIAEPSTVPEVTTPEVTVPEATMPEVTVPEATMPEVTTPSTPTPVPPTTTPQEPAGVKPKLTETVDAPSGTVTAGKTADGRVALVDGDGILLVEGNAGPNAKLQWQDDQDVLWMTGGGQVYRIMKSSDGTWKFYLDSGQKLPDGIG